MAEILARRFDKLSMRISTEPPFVLTLSLSKGEDAAVAAANALNVRRPSPR